MTQDFDNENVPTVLVTSAEQGGVLAATARYVPSDTTDNTYRQLPADNEPPGNYVLEGRVQERVVGRMFQKRIFEITDGGVARITDGLYQHQVTLKILDGAFAHLQERLSQLKESVTALDQFIGVVARQSNYDYGADKIRDTFVNSLARSGDNFIPAPIVCLVLYLEILDLLTDMTQDQKNTFAQNIYCSLDPANTTLNLLGEFRNQIDSLCTKFESIVRPQVYSAALKSGTRASAATQGARLSEEISLNLKLGGIIDSNLPKNVGFNYLYPSDDEIQTLTVNTDTLRDTIDEQLSIFTGDVYSAGELENLGFSPEEIRAMGEESNRYSYLSPAQLQMGRLSINLVNQKEESYTAVKAALQTVLNDQSVGSPVANPGKRVMDLLSYNGTGISQERNEKLKDIYVELAQNNNINVNSLNPDLTYGCAAQTTSEQFVGANSEFISVKQGDNPNSNTVRTVKEQYVDATSALENVLSILNVSSQKDVTFGAAQLAQISFDLEQTNNFVDKRIKANAKNNAANQVKNETVAKLKNLPVPLKKLTLSKEAVFADGISTTNDAKSSGFDVVMKELRAIEFLSRYENNFMKAPRWKLLTDINNIRTNLLCRIRRHTDPDTQVGTNEAWSNIPVYNEYFILTPPGGTTSRPAQTSTARQTLARSGQLGYERNSVIETLGSTLTQQLIKLESESVRVHSHLEFISDAAPGAPTNFVGKITGLMKK